MKDMDKMNKEIQMGDRIFARLTMGGRVILEFMINSVESMSGLLDEVRRMTGNLRGLGRLQVRNQSRGWAAVSSLMFYGESSSSSNNPFGVFNVESVGHEIGATPFGRATSNMTPRPVHTLFPWETH